MVLRTIRTLLIISYVLLFCRVLGASASDGEKTLKRTVDAIVFAGNKIPALKGGALVSQTLYARSDGSWKPIPFQVDEKTPDGKYAFATWLNGKPLKDDGLWDANDELVFMAADMGDRAGEVQWPDKATRGFEITATDPDDGGKAYAYLFEFSGNAPVCPTDYIRYDVKGMAIDSVDYYVGDDPKAPISIGKFQIKPAFGGSGVDVADRLKIRVKAKVVGGFELDRTEEDFNVRIMGYTDGPVRVIRHTRTWQDLFWNIPSPSSYQTTVYYRNQMIFPITIEVPFDMSLFFRDLQLRVSVDTPCTVPGPRKYYNNHNTAGVDVDGVMSDAERNLNKGQVKWQVIAGTSDQHPEGWMSRQTVISTKEVPITLPLFYADDVTTPDPPENIPGSCGNLGFEIIGLDMLKKGKMTIIVSQFPLLRYKPGDEDIYLKTQDRPLRVTATQIK
jgi:hypothetical protein